MDIHPPEKPIHSVRDFLIQIFTITCGILIALGLEDLVTSHREAALLAQTRAALTTEMQGNRQRLVEANASEEAEQKYLDAVVAWAETRFTPHPAKEPGATPTRGFVALRAAAWESALAAQATRLLTPREMQALSLAYNGQLVQGQFRAKAVEQWVALSAWGDAEKLGPDETKQVLRELRVAQSYNRILHGLQQTVVGQYDGALKAIAEASH